MTADKLDTLVFFAVSVFGTFGLWIAPKMQLSGDECALGLMIALAVVWVMRLWMNGYFSFGMWAIWRSSPEQAEVE